MIAYIVKTIICSAFLILIYYLIFEREKMHFFKRCYLLFAIIFPFIVPLITIEIKLPDQLQYIPINAATLDIQGTVNQQIPSSENKLLLSDLLPFFYLTVSVVLLIRFLRNLYILRVKIKNSRIIYYMGSKVALTNERVAPHSFLNFIFISEKDFKQGVIEEEILNHELAHVKQLHSMDILLIEIITIFAWINPMLALYKRAVQLNHEFLADEHVTGALKEIHPYQMLLLSRLNQPKRMYFASPFNYLDIKKRIIMMNRKVSYKHAILKQIALIPIFGVMTLVFASKTVAQEPISVVGNTPYNQQEASQDLLKEYQSILDKYIYSLPDGKRVQRLNISKEDKDKLEKIFFQMSKEQQESQVIAFVPKSTMFLKVTVPTKEQIESFKETKTYGVWIDGKRVNNEELEKFDNADFSFVSVSKLQSNALNYGKHVYQVDLMTNTAYQDYYSKAIAQEGYILMPSAKRVRNKTP